jgi:hypothetical protein
MTNPATTLPFDNISDHSETVAETCQNSGRSAPQRKASLGPLSIQTSPNLAARARALFGNFASLYVRGVGDVEVYVERYATTERGELIAFFRHPKTKMLQFDGVVLDDDGEFKATVQK